MFWNLVYLESIHQNKKLKLKVPTILKMWKNSLVLVSIEYINYCARKDK